MSSLSLKVHTPVNMETLKLIVISLQTGGWDASMLVCGAVYMLAGVVYLTTVTGEVQEWNDYEELPSSDDLE